MRLPAPIFSHASAAFIAAFLLAGCAGSETPETPEAETACLPAAEMATALRDRYGETAVWIGRTESGITVLYLAPTRTWTIVTLAEELACIERAGRGFEIGGGET